MSDINDPREIRAAEAQEAVRRDLEVREAALALDDEETKAVERDKVGDVNLTTGDIGHDASATGATIGAVGGAIAGAAAGSILGPPGAVAGAIAGAMTGAGVAGLAVEAIEEAELSSNDERLDNERANNDTSPIV